MRQRAGNMPVIHPARKGEMKKTGRDFQMEFRNANLLPCWLVEYEHESTRTEPKTCQSIWALKTLAKKSKLAPFRLGPFWDVPFREPD